MAQRRTFVDKIDHKQAGLSETSLNEKIDKLNNFFHTSRPMHFDKEGRQIIYDGLGLNLKHRLGTFFHWIMLGCYVGAYQYYPIAEAIGFWGVQSIPFYAFGGVGIA